MLRTAGMTTSSSTFRCSNTHRLHSILRLYAATDVSFRDFHFSLSFLCFFFRFYLFASCSLAPPLQLGRIEIENKRNNKKTTLRKLLFSNNSHTIPFIVFPRGTISLSKNKNDTNIFRNFIPIVSIISWYQRNFSFYSKYHFFFQ